MPKENLIHNAVKNKVKEAFDLEKLKNELPELPAQKRNRYEKDFDLKLQDAEILAEEKSMTDYFEAVAKYSNPKLAANWVINELKAEGILKIEPEKLVEMIQMIDDNTISGKIAKEVFAEMLSSGKSAGEIVEEKGLKQVGDEDEIAKVINEVISENESAFKDLENGKQEALGFLVGKVMQKTKGQANPGIVNKLLKERVENV